MKGTTKPTAGILFILSVLIPSLFLGYFALRAVDREEAYIEKRFEDTLLADVMHTVSVINNELEEIKNKLHDECNGISQENINEIFGPPEEMNILIETPFAVTGDFTVLWPDKRDNLKESEQGLLDQHTGFLIDEVSIPVYKNIAIAYKDVIINEQQKFNWDSKESDNVSKNMGINLISNDADVFNEEYMNQNVQIQFEQDENVRNRVYEQVLEEGNKLNFRSVQGQKKENKKTNPESIFISEQLSFSQITLGQEYGLIPRIMEDTLALYFWTKTDSGYITGCLVHQGEFKKRILAVIQHIYTRVRILTVLDEDGVPLVIPEEPYNRNWKLPFVSREISEILPRWEVAAYLTDPDMISSQARSFASVMWILICILIISIVAGGILILRSFYSEIVLAQQKTTFVSNVSHELKTPLTSIRLFAEMLKEERQPDKTKQKNYLRLMVAETERLSRLINNVLDFSKMGQKKKQYAMEETDIVYLCRTLLESQRLRLEQNGFKIEFSASKELEIVYADGGSLKQAFLNLIANAEKYSAQQKEIKMELVSSDGYIRIKIKDRGIGIPVKYIKKIFKEFYRIDDSLTSRVRGSGLGLTITKRIIEAHNGTVQYIPHHGGGSIFQVTLPIFKHRGPK